MGQKSGQDLSGALLRSRVAMKVSPGPHSHLETPLEETLLPSSLGLWAESSSQPASGGDGPSADCQLQTAVRSQRPSSCPGSACSSLQSELYQPGYFLHQLNKKNLPLPLAETESPIT